MNADRFTRQTILSIHPWTANLVSFRITRPENFRFSAGQFARLGLVKSATSGGGESAEAIVWRAYSVASATTDPFLEFCSVLLPEGEFTSELARLNVGEDICIENASYGFLTPAGFLPGPDLWMIATGTGLAPFVSMLLEPEIWQVYRNLVVVHSVRYSAELAYRDTLLGLPAKHLIGASGARLHYIPIVTREPATTELSARVPTLLADGRLEARVALALQPDSARVMLCGNPQMVTAMREMLGARGFATSRRAKPGTLAVENYW